MSLPSVRQVLARATAAAGAYARRRYRGARRLATDDGMRPALAYLLALVAAAASIGSFLLSGGGSPGRVEFGLLVVSFGLVFYVSLRQAGMSARRRY